MARKTTDTRPPKVYREPVVYEVGTDISPEQYEELLIKVADWFAEWRNTKEAGALARKYIRCCMDGKTLEGQPWYSAWNSTLASRVKMLCRFDLEKMAPIHSASEKEQKKKEKEKQKATAKRLATDPLVPELTRQEQKNTKAAYGDSPHALLTEAENRTWQKYYKSYTDEFPELRTVNAQAELSLLCDLHVVFERNRLKLVKGEKVDTFAMQDTTKLIVDLKKALGIHPDQLAKRVQVETGGTISEVSAKLAAMKGTGRDLRLRWWLEEMLICWQMMHTPSPRPENGGYQLDEIGLFGLTKCRTCVCPKCQTRNFVGIEVTEIEAYLVDKGVLEPIQSVDQLPPDNPRELKVLVVDHDAADAEDDDEFDAQHGNDDLDDEDDEAGDADDE